MSRVWAAALLGVMACQKPVDSAITVVREESAGGVRLTLIAKPSVQINAQLKPALELKDGTILRFDSPELSADSAYFTGAPVLLVPTGTAARGKIRASVCDSGESVCRLVTVALK